MSQELANIPGITLAVWVMCAGFVLAILMKLGSWIFSSNA